MGEKLAVLGSPIAHSKSPLIHAAAYEELGLSWRYTRIRVGEDGLAPFLDGRGPGWRGFSLTMPLKEEAHRVAAALDPAAMESGVVNTLLRLSGPGTPRWAGFNTDVGGLAEAVRKAGLDATRTAVIGSGATAVSAILAARSLGAEHVSILARNIRATSDLVARFADSHEPGSQLRLHVEGTSLRHPEALDVALHPALEATLVISTLPGPAGRELELPAALMRIPLFDVAYDPWPSPLAERWRAAGGTAHAGIDMLVEQALLQIRVFANGDPGLPLEAEERVLAAMHRAAGSRS
ncbi:shikimate dehydrogenase [Leucobacter sp. CSA1]|uniref:Shikimate dehydrogenase n=2 Tax=Leucobacter chromiisoli TaxID=2796471 RepID=A0A934Q7B2_9MICO|nr:shikimate dehydrogenase [Leucobacter chromiisoli]